MSRPIEIRTSPHLKRARTVPQIMQGVVWALLPICAFAVFQFGLSAMLLLVTTTAVAMATEYLFARLSGRGTVQRARLLDFRTLPHLFPDVGEGTLVRGIQVRDFRMRFPDWLEQIEILAREVLPRVSEPTAVGV